MVVLFAVQFPIPEVAAGGEGLLTRRALQTLLVPGRLVDSHQEAVGDRPLAALADGGMRTVRACCAQGESQPSAPPGPAPAFRGARCPQSLASKARMAQKRRPLPVLPSPPGRGRAPGSPSQYAPGFGLPRRLPRPWSLG